MMDCTFDAMIPGGRDALALALKAEGLPTDDVAEPGRTFFRLSDGDGPIGYVGLEGTGADRLVRSLVVLPSRRSRGYGAMLAERAESVARLDEVRFLHLLTTDAAGFFRSLGYKDADRTKAPSSIANSRQFASLCPANAIYLIKELT
jgi:amino-acid N-acetyltransferase